MSFVRVVHSDVTASAPGDAVVDAAVEDGVGAEDDVDCLWQPHTAAAMASTGPSSLLACLISVASEREVDVGAISRSTIVQSPDCNNLDLRTTVVVRIRASRP
jgi:hypothetical protein